MLGRWLDAGCGFTALLPVGERPAHAPGRLGGPRAQKARRGARSCEHGRCCMSDPGDDGRGIAGDDGASAMPAQPCGSRPFLEDAPVSTQQPNPAVVPQPCSAEELPPQASLASCQLELLAVDAPGTGAS